MQDLRHEQQTKKPFIGGPKKPNFLMKSLIFLWTYRWWVVGIFTTFIVLNIIFNPINTATTLANWVNDFVGTFLDVVNFDD